MVIRNFHCWRAAHTKLVIFQLQRADASAALKVFVGIARSRPGGSRPSRTAGRQVVRPAARADAGAAAFQELPHDAVGAGGLLRHVQAPDGKTPGQDEYVRPMQPVPKNFSPTDWVIA